MQCNYFIIIKTAPILYLPNLYAFNKKEVNLNINRNFFIQSNAFGVIIL